MELSRANGLCGCGRRCWPHGACFAWMPCYLNVLSERRCVVGRLIKHTGLARHMYFLTCVYLSFYFTTGICDLFGHLMTDLPQQWCSFSVIWKVSLLGYCRSLLLIPVGNCTATSAVRQRPVRHPPNVERYSLSLAPDKSYCQWLG